MLVNFAAERRGKETPSEMFDRAMVARAMVWRWDTVSLEAQMCWLDSLSSVGTFSTTVH